jgi:regulator of protease activity HflC (stomatin/prohibitin superfamily)
MEGALAWISEIVGWFGQFIPRWEIVDTRRGAIKWVRGSKVVALGPGLHCYWPVTTKFEVYPIARQTINLATQTLVTRDDRTIGVSGVVSYEIKDLEKILAETYDPDQTIADIAMAAIHDVCCNRAWSDLKTTQQDGTLDRDLRREVAKELDRYGVRVLRTRLTDLAPTRCYKVVQAAAKDGA